MISAEVLESVKTVLVQQCGASPLALRDLGVHWPQCIEYRFQGALGFGGKLWANNGRWYVTCYLEDVTEERFLMIQHANKRLAVLSDTRQEEAQ